MNIGGFNIGNFLGTVGAAAGVALAGSGGPLGLSALIGSKALGFVGKSVGNAIEGKSGANIESDFAQILQDIAQQGMKTGLYNLPNLLKK